MRKIRSSVSCAVTALLASQLLAVTAEAASRDAEDACIADAVRQADSMTTVAAIRQQCIEDSGQVPPEPQAPDESTETSMVMDRMSRERRMGDGDPVLVPHQRNYLLPVSYVREPNGAPFRNAFGDLLPDESLDNLEAKFQISLKYSLADNLLLPRDELYIAFTSTSFWQVYNSEISSVFRETIYEPEIFWAAPLKWRPFRSDASLLVLGFDHQSNGQAGTLSRSWNRLYANFILEKDNFVFSFKPWWRIPENEKSDPLDPTGDDNPDIEDYMGKFEFTTLYKGGSNEFALMLRNNLQSENRGAIQLEWTFPIWRGIRGYAQYFNGYGESLIDYNARTERLGIGFLLTDLL